MTTHRLSAEEEKRIRENVEFYSSITVHPIGMAVVSLDTFGPDTLLSELDALRAELAQAQEENKRLDADLRKWGINDAAMLNIMHQQYLDTTEENRVLREGVRVTRNALDRIQRNFDLDQAIEDIIQRGNETFRG